MRAAVRTRRGGFFEKVFLYLEFLLSILLCRRTRLKLSSSERDKRGAFREVFSILSIVLSILPCLSSKQALQARSSFEREASVLTPSLYTTGFVETLIEIKCILPPIRGSQPDQVIRGKPAQCRSTVGAPKNRQRILSVHRSGWSRNAGPQTAAVLLGSR